MKVLNNHAKQAKEKYTNKKKKKQMKCKQTSNNESEKQVMGETEWYINVKETNICSLN